MGNVKVFNHESQVVMEAYHDWIGALLKVDKTAQGKKNFHRIKIFRKKMKKKLDSRISSLIQNSVTSNHRSLIIIVGDQGREQVPL